MLLDVKHTTYKVVNVCTIAQHIICVFESRLALLKMRCSTSFFWVWRLFIIFLQKKLSSKYSKWIHIYFCLLLLLKWFSDLNVLLHKCLQKFFFRGVDTEVYVKFISPCYHLQRSSAPCFVYYRGKCLYYRKRGFNIQNFEELPGLRHNFQFLSTGL
jgi:hypothetical protein